MFSFFKRKKTVSYRDIIWFSEQAKQLQLIVNLKELAEKKPVVVISFFRAEIEDLRSKLVQLNLSVGEANELTQTPSKGIYPIVSEELSRLNLVFGVDVEYVFINHNPILERDEQLRAHCAVLRSGAKISYFISLDSPLLSVFGTDNLKSMLKKLGFQENESLEHKMISNSIIKAQQKISTAVRNAYDAESEVDWFAKNYRS